MLSLASETEAYIMGTFLPAMVETPTTRGTISAALNTVDISSLGKLISRSSLDSRPISSTLLFLCNESPVR